MKFLRDIKGREKKEKDFLVKGETTKTNLFERFYLLLIFGVLVVVVLNGFKVFNKADHLQGQLTDQASAGFSQLLAGGNEIGKASFGEALQTFEAAEAYFEDLEDVLWFTTRDNSIYGNNDDLLGAANNVVLSGRHFAQAGQHFLEVSKVFEQVPLYFLASNKDPEDLSLPAITDLLAEGLAEAEKAIVEIAEAERLIEEIEVEAVPDYLVEKVGQAKEMIATVSGILNETAEYFPAILDLLGHEKPHRYLVIFQNNNEIRPTGGFIGSYMVFEMNKGRLENMAVEDVYHLDDPFKGFVEPPIQLRALSDNLRFRDSNFSPDFPTSARKLMEMYELEGGQAVDTVVALNQSSLKDFLEISGPVKAGDFGLLDNENYNVLLTYIIEAKVSGRQDPKAILKDFVPAFRDQLLAQKNYSRILLVTYNEMQKKNILAYSKNAEVEGLMAFLGIDGKLRHVENEDFLAVVNISIGGTKSDGFVEEVIDHWTIIDEDGGVENTLNITHSHKWNETIEDYWRDLLRENGFGQPEDYVLDILGRGRNRSVVQIYLPAGVEILSADVEEYVLEYDKDTKKDFISFVMEVRPGESASAEFRYKLPFDLTKNGETFEYNVYFSKQPGSAGSLLNKRIRALGLENVAIYPPEFATNFGGELEYNGNLVFDRLMRTAWR